MAEKKKQKNVSKMKKNPEAQKGIEEIFATSPNNDKEDFIKVKPKKKKTKKEKIVAEEVKEETKQVKKTTNKKKKEVPVVKPTIEEKRIENENVDSQIIDHRKREIGVIVITILIVIFAGISLYTLNRINHKLNRLDKKLKEPETKLEYVNPKVVFFGDSITDFWNLDQYFDVHHINKGISGNVTDSLLDRIEKDVIDYQPKKVFILIGTNDLAAGKKSEYIARQINKIIVKIKNESPNTEIYIESILPINDDEDEDKINLDAVGDRKNSDIKKTNQLIEEICKKQEVTYIDTHSEFVNEDGRLKLNYTKEGLHLSDEGYEKLTSIIKKYL